MNDNHQVGLHYIDSGGYSCPASEGFVDFFGDGGGGGGFPAAPLHYFNTGPIPMHDQESAYWSMQHMNSYRYGLSGSESTSSYYGMYEDNEHSRRMDLNRRDWEYPSITMSEDPTAVDLPSEQSMTTTVHSIPEERSPHHEDADSTQVLWEDDIDPDNMTYEELLDLGEAVGTESRGLPQELINLLPTSKHKSGGIFSRRKSGDRCVICQMRYKRGDRQINLPCKHAYHADCVSKWLSINKACPVCNTEVFGEESTN